jgi:hypothetical protein
MPNVNGKKFPYTTKGKADAKRAESAMDKKGARRNALKNYMDRTMGSATKSPDTTGNTGNMKKTMPDSMKRNMPEGRTKNMNKGGY